MENKQYTTHAHRQRRAFNSRPQQAAQPYHLQVNSPDVAHDLEVITVSGVQDIGRNCYVVRYRDEYVVIDAGNGFTDVVLGIDSMIPDTTWLKAHKKKIKALVLTHGHLDHIGGVPYVLEDLGFPQIIGTSFTIELLKHHLREHKLLNKVQLKVIDRNADVQLTPQIKLEFFGVTHSIPYSTGVAVRTNGGTVVYTGDFKLDPKPIREPVTAIDRIAQIANRGVTVMLTDSTNSFEAGRAPSESTVRDNLLPLIKAQPGRVIIATFSSMVSRLSALIDIAQQTNRRVVVTGRSLATNLRIAQEINYINPIRNLVIDIKQMNKYPDNQLMVLCTGSQGEPSAALTRMAEGTHQAITLKKGDSIIMASSMIPTRVADITALQDKLVSRGVTVFSKKSMDIHASGHAYQEEQIEMAKMLKPKFIIPVHGYLSFLAQHKQVLSDAGFDGKKIYVTQSGQRWGVTDSVLVPLKKITVHDRYVVNRKVLEADDAFVHSRMTMARGGVLVAWVDITEQGHVKKCKVTIRGVRSKVESQEIVHSMETQIPQWLMNAKMRPGLPAEQYQRLMKQFLYKKLGIWFSKQYQHPPLMLVEVA